MLLLKTDKILNICFGENAMNLLRASYPIIKSVVCISDDLSIGEISDLDRYTGKPFLLTINDINCWENSFEIEYKNFEKEIRKYEEVVIWYSNSPFEFCGMLYVMWKLKNSEAKVYYINTSEIHKQVKNNNSIVWCVGEINYEDVLSYMNLKRTVSFEEKIFYYETWEELMIENKELRSFENGKIVGVDIDYYDQFIFECIDYTPKNIKDIIFDSIYNINLEKGNRINDKIIISRVQKLIEDKKLKKVGYEKDFYKNLIMKI